ncbi:hypothetical protein [Streptomyces sp. SAS_270]|uniref:hypothetical protein n=1 Tax=Streptomyces sp. SAS_270 TaxID=3412748 RepID=UPI00403C10FB
MNAVAAGETDTGESAAQERTGTVRVADGCHIGQACAVYMVTDNKQRQSCERF